MKCLVTFGTVEGHTRRVADAIVTSIVDLQHQADLSDTSNLKQDLVLKDYDACLVAAPVHQQRHPDDVINFAKTNSDQLNRIPSALISVSLSAALPGGEAEAQSYVDRLLGTTGWTPTSTHCVGGALKYTQYDFFQEQVIRHVVLKGRDVGDIRGDHAFTDWNALNLFIESFIGAAAGSN